MDRVISLCKRFEGFRANPYICPAGVATIGYGSTFYPDGTKVTLRDAPISKAYAQEILIYTLKTIYIPGVRKLCPDIPQNGLFWALVDFTYNLGVARLKNSTLRKRANAGDIEGVKIELMKWVKGNGKTLQGLVLRRSAECLLVDEK